MKLISVIHRRPGGRRARPVPPLPIAASLALLLPLSFAALASPAAAAAAHPGGATRACPWLNQSLPISQRVRLLLSKMTLANEITMVEGLFPFGYGLSYTSFACSDLHISPSRFANRVSGPGPASCHCNGQRARLVRVTARVTNTGRVTGSDVAQLYLGDPAAAGEPPRQLRGFRRVTLRPGQSAVVRFTLDGHDLSYWKDSANGWVVPAGGFRVYLGDSSALPGLPLRGDFTVTSSG